METSLRDPQPFDLQGHRGARGLRPENTLPGFAHALSIGVTTLELDAAVTKDGVVIVSHDRCLNPDITRDERGEWLTSRGPAFCTLTFDEVQRYDVGRIRPGSVYAARFPEQVPLDGTRIPALRDLFDLVERSGDTTLRFNIETKLDPTRPEEALEPGPFAAALINEVRRARAERRTTIQSFAWRTLFIARETAPEIATVCLTSQQPEDDTVHLGRAIASPWLAGLDPSTYDGSVPRLVSAAGAPIWSPNRLDLSPALVQEAHGLGLRVIPWTANDPADMARLVDMGIDGLISDRPDVLRAVLAERKDPPLLPAPVIP